MIDYLLICDKNKFNPNYSQMKKLTLGKFFTLFALVFTVKLVEAQCTTQSSNPSGTVSGSSSCGGCTNSITSANNNTTINMTSSVNDVYCVATGQTVTGITLNWTRGTLRVCGDLTITTLNVGFPTGTTDFARIVVESSGTLNFTNAFTLQQNTGITNNGILNFNKTGSNPIVTNNDAYIITNSKWAQTTFKGGLTTNATSNIINKGSMFITGGTASINTGSGSWCFERSFTTVVDFTNNAFNGIVFSSSSGDAASTAVINYTGTQSMNDTLTYSAIKYCRNGAGTASPVSKGGSAIQSASSCASVVPVILTNFIAKQQHDGILVSWNTAMEHNSKDFVLERSLDGENFEKVQTVQAKGNSNSPQSYFVFDDYNSNGAIVYYRIIATDIDGKFDTSPTISVNSNGNGNSLEAFPNPFTQGNLYVRAHDNDSELILELYDITGKVLSVNTLKNVTDGSIYKVGNILNDFPKGEYILKAVSDHSVDNIKIIKN